MLRFRSIVPAVLALVAVPLALAADQPAAKPAPPSKGTYPEVLAAFGDQNITKDQAFDLLIANVAQQANMQPAELIAEIVDEIVARQLVEAAAKKDGKTSEQWMQEQVEKRSKEPTDAEIQALYNQVKPQLGEQTLEQAKPQLANYLKRQQGGQVSDAVIAELRGQTQVKLFVEPTRVEVADGGRPGRGPKTAPVQIVMWSDYQCPFCSRIEETLAKVVSTYGEKVRIVFRDYPLSFHQNAQKAAEAASCADDQGKFWDMHDKLFANQGALAVDDLKKYAGELKLDTAKFSECLDSGRKADGVKKDIADGSAVGVTGTPALFVNGRFLNGAVPYEKVAAAIDQELRRTAPAAPQATPAAAAKPGA